MSFVARGRRQNALGQLRAQVLYRGNSLTVGYLIPDPSVDSYPAQSAAALGPLWVYQNLGVSAWQTSQLDAADPAVMDPLYSTSWVNNVAVLWEITNDLKFNQNAADAYSRYVTWCQNRRAVGFAIVAVTVLPRSLADTYAGFEADRQTVNASIRLNWASYADALADVGNNPTIGQPGDQANTAYYYDGVHLNPAGASIVAAVVNAAIGVV